LDIVNNRAKKKNTFLYIDAKQVVYKGYNIHFRVEPGAGVGGYFTAVKTFFTLNILGLFWTR